MRHYPAFPGGYAIFADDIRQEVSGKITIVGTYFTELIATGEPPFILPQLCVMVAFRDDPASLPKDLVLRILHQGSDKEEVMWEQHVSLPKPSADDLETIVPNDPHFRRMVELLTFARFVPFGFREESRISVRAYIGDDEVRIGSLALRIRPPQQTPEQSAE